MTVGPGSTAGKITEVPAEISGQWSVASGQ